MQEALKIFETLPDAVFVQAAGRFVYVNRSALELFGAARRSQLLGQPLSGFIHPDSRHEPLNLSGELAERVFQRLDGIPVAVELSAVVAPWEGQEAVLFFARNLSERLRLEEQAAQVRASRFGRSLTDAIGEGVIGVDEAHRVVFGNPKARELLDMDEETMLGRKLDDVVKAATGEGTSLTDATCPAWGKVAQGQTFQTDNWTFERADGCRFPVGLTITPLLEAGRVSGSVLTFHDNTRRKLAESALAHYTAQLEQTNLQLAAARDTAQRFRIALDSSQDAIFLIDRATMGFLDANESAYRQLGYTREELLALGPHDIKPEFDRAALARFFDDINASPGGSGTLETRHQRKDGSTFPVEVNLRALTLNGRITMTAVVRDITLRKAAEDELKRNLVELGRTNAELDQFTYVASHDLQEPLRKVMAFSDWLRRDMGSELPAKADQDLRFICDATQRMQNLVQDLLTLSRAGRISMTRQRFCLDGAVDAALDNLSMCVTESAAQISREPLPEAIGDPSLLAQLYQNLLSNALKYVGAAPPHILITCREEDGCRVFGVQDQGIGLKPDYAEQIFEPFKRLHGRGKYDGTGIGLAICRKIVQRHGGRIWVESDEGEGAHFRFTLGETGGTR